MDNQYLSKEKECPLTNKMCDKADCKSCDICIKEEELYQECINREY